MSHTENVDLLLQLILEPGPEFLDFRLYDECTVRLVWIILEVILVIILGFIKVTEFCDFRYDRVRVYAGSIHRNF